MGQPPGTPPWSLEEDDLLLSVLHHDNTGDGPQIYASWNEIADVMNEQASAAGIRNRKYSGKMLFRRWSSHGRQRFHPGPQADMTPAPHAYATVTLNTYPVPSTSLPAFWEVVREALNLNVHAWSNALPPFRAGFGLTPSLGRTRHLEPWLTGPPRSFEEAVQSRRW